MLIRGSYRGSLRFTDVSHLQAACELDAEVLWGGDGPKDKEQVNPRLRVRPRVVPGLAGHKSGP